MVMAYTSIVIMSSLVKLVSDQGIPPDETLFCRFFIGLMLTLPLIFRGPKFDWHIHDYRASLLRNGAGLASMLFMFYSLKYLPLSSAVLLANTSALFAPLFVLILYRQKTSRVTLACTAGGFSGVCIVLLDANTRQVSSPYLFIGLLGAALAALAYLGVKSLTRRHCALNVIFYFYLSGTLVLPFTYSADWAVPSAYEAMLLLGVGVFGLGFQFFLTKALALAEISEITPFIFINVILSALADWLLWSTIPNTGFWLGTLVILFSLHGITAFNKRPNTTTRPPP